MEAVRQIDLHALIPRFAPLRLHEAARLARLVASIEQQGQLMPVVAVADPDQDRQWVLIDGYRRLEALRRLGEDLIWVDVWARSVDEALLACLARGPERAWEAIEEAALIEELSNRHSLHTIAQRLGRDVSWVSRRLALLKALPEDLLEQVRAGRISVWAATRILAPLARANSAHARILLSQLAHQPLSTRELKRLYGQYREATQRQRERLVANPALFLQALERREQDRAERRLAEGPEGAWCQDLAVVRAILKRLVRQVPRLFAPSQDPQERARLAQAFAPAKAQFQRLDQALAEVAGHDR
jgi:ParB/RepB/Spo0J family partition protein